MKAALPRSGTRPAAAANRARPGGSTGTKAPQRERHRDKSTAAGSGWLRGRRGCDPPRKDTARARRIPRSPPGIPRSPAPARTPPTAWVSPARPRPPAAAVDFYLHLRALVSPASLRRRPGAAREPEPLPPPAGGNREEGDEHPGADSPAPRRHRAGSGGAERAEGREGGTAAAAPRPPHTLPLTHTAGGRNRGEEPRLALPQPMKPLVKPRVKPQAPRPCLLRAPPLPRSAGAAPRAPVRRTALPATPRRSPLPPAERLVRSVLLQSSPLVSGGRGRELPLPRGKGRRRTGRLSALRNLPWQATLAARSAASVVLRAAVD